MSPLKKPVCRLTHPVLLNLQTVEEVYWRESLRYISEHSLNKASQKRSKSNREYENQNTVKKTKLTKSDENRLKKTKIDEN